MGADGTARTGDPAVRRAEVEAADRPYAGTRAADLLVGDRRLRIEGLDPAREALLRDRWGPFLDAAAGAADWTLRLLDAGEGPWLPDPRPGDRYRVEAAGKGSQAVSYGFSVWTGPHGRRVAAIRRGGGEPEGRLLDNAVRLTVLRCAVEAGGLALHAAGVLRAGRADVLAGPSRAGKSTAVVLSREAGGASLGDDLALLLPAGDGFAVPALPFDNSEAVREAPAPGPYPLRAVWRLRQAPYHAARLREGPVAVAELVGCAAFAWALPDLAERTARAAARVVAAGRFGELEFRPDPGFWRAVDGVPIGETRD